MTFHMTFLLCNKSLVTTRRGALIGGERIVDPNQCYFFLGRWPTRCTLTFAYINEPITNLSIQYRVRAWL